MSRTKQDVYTKLAVSLLAEAFASTFDDRKNATVVDCNSNTTDEDIDQMFLRCRQYCSHIVADDLIKAKVAETKNREKILQTTTCRGIKLFLNSCVAPLAT